MIHTCRSLMALVAALGIAGLIPAVPLGAQTLNDSFPHPNDAAPILRAQADSALAQAKDSSPAIPVLPSPSKATSYSLAATFVPVAVGLGIASLGGSDTDQGPKQAVAGVAIVAGAILGPSAGYFYGGCPERARQGIALRVAIGGLASLMAVAVAESRESDDWLDFSGVIAAVGVGVIGVGGVTISALYDIGRVRSEVRANNLKRTTPQLGLAPDLLHGDTPGLTLSLRF